MIQVIDEFLGEFYEGSIHFRDNLQFELKSEFFIYPNIKKNIYKQEIYLFIPNALQINPSTYPKEQFYLDQTTLIRYKTPPFSLQELVQSDNLKSPLVRLQQVMQDSSFPLDKPFISDELKLLGNIFRAAVRDQVGDLLTSLKQSYDIQTKLTSLCADIHKVRKQFLDIQKSFFSNYPSEIELQNHFKHTDEYISHVIDYYLTSLLKVLRESGLDHIPLRDLILQEQQYRQKCYLKPETSSDTKYANEAVLYRSSLLNKFMLEALQLHSNRLSLEEKHGHLLGAIAAGVAMSVYMILFVLTWQSPVFVINSIPFILLVVVFYMLKDRIKEGVKKFYSRQAVRWLPDYSTEIKNRKGLTIGKLHENLSFIDEKQLPAEFREIRNKEFHDELPDLKRQETILQYKREIVLNQQPSMLESRRRELTIIFRLNIHRFLQKASDAFQTNLELDKNSLNITEKPLPRVYHINIIILNTYMKANMETESEIKKFRVVIDKFGIKRVEQIGMTST